MNVVEYVEKYGDYSFKEKVFNEIDNLVFSELVYLNFDESDNTIENIGKNYLKKNRYKNIKKLGPAQDTAYRVLEKAINKKRYKDIVMKDYVFKHNINCQFSAATFIIDNNLNYIAFEGTDELISGWKEDFLMASYFPIPSQIEAHDYLDKHIKLIGPDIIVGGHSKGGNLALVGSMYLKLSKQVKIRKIYSNDGPGLRKKELKTFRYKLIKNKYTHFVADHTIVGILLRDEKHKYIKTTKRNVFAHDIGTWIIKENELEETNLSNSSLRIQNNLINWLDSHTYYERYTMVNDIFQVLEDNKINTIYDIVKLNNLIKVIKGLKSIDKQSKDLAINLLKAIFKKA